LAQVLSRKAPKLRDKDCAQQRAERAGKSGGGARGRDANNVCSSGECPVPPDDAPTDRARAPIRLGVCPTILPTGNRCRVAWRVRGLRESVRESGKRTGTRRNEAQDAQNHCFNPFSIPSTSRPPTRNVPGTYIVNFSMLVHHTGKKTADSKRSLPFHRPFVAVRPLLARQQPINDVHVIPTQHPSRALRT
jgi:hypothetical protein